MISIKTDSGRFNFRAAGIFIHNNKVLIHRLMPDDFYTFPGGRVELYEDTEITIIREMKEELNVNIEVVRLLWVVESFFTYKQDRIHELCFYYLVDSKDASLLQKEDCFTVIEGDYTFEFKWMDIRDVKDAVLYPIFIKSSLDNLPSNIEKVVIKSEE